MTREQRRALGWAIGAVAAAILVGAIVVAAMLAGQKPVGPGVVLHVQPNVKTGPTFSVLKMFDVNTGWAVAETTISSEVLLRTEHGPTTWQDVTPAVVRRQGGLLQVEVFDHSHAWLYKRHSMEIFRTSDGGNTWQSTPIAVAGEWASFSFVDPLRGWVLITRENDAGVLLFHTTDGGATWGQLVEAGSLSASHGLAGNGAVGGMTFTDLDHGWIVMASNLRPVATVLRTTDGGSDWIAIDLPIPEAYKGFSPGVSGPSLFNASNGVISVTFDLTQAGGQTHSDVIVYSTRDAGLSWEPSTPLHDGFSTAEFINAKVGWVPANRGRIVYATTDAGVTWQPTKTLVSIASGTPHYLNSATQNWSATNLDFIDTQHGWAIASFGSGVNEIPDKIFETHDGGENWNRIDFSITN